MAIDSSLFAYDLPAATYNTGDVVNLGIVEGPAMVRSGRGQAILKRITAGLIVNNGTLWRIHVKNSDWVDDVINFTGYLNEDTAMDVHSGIIQSGNNANLTPNSGWQVYAECILGGTPSVASTLFALIDIDYPAVSAIADPDELVGIPTTIRQDITSVYLYANGGMSGASWKTVNVDYFKAGYQYCLQEVNLVTSSATAVTGFVALANAAGMGGLQRIIPVNDVRSGIKTTIKYATKLVKGPMDVKVMLFTTSAGYADVFMVHDYVKRQGA